MIAHGGAALIDRKGGSGGGGTITSVSNSDGTLTISPTTGDVVASMAVNFGGLGIITIDGENSDLCSIFQNNDDDFSSGTYSLPLSALIVRDNYGYQLLLRGYEIQALHNGTPTASVGLNINAYGGAVSIGSLSNPDTITLNGANLLLYFGSVALPPVVSIGGVGAGSPLDIAGLGNTNATFLLRGFNSSSIEIFRIANNGDTGIGIGANTISARLHVISTAEQLRIGYDASNYYSTTVGSTGGVTLDAVGAGALFTFSDNVVVPDLKATTYHVGSTAGIDATVTYVDTLLGAKTLTFNKGILTAQT